MPFLRDHKLSIRRNPYAYGICSKLLGSLLFLIILSVSATIRVLAQDEAPASKYPLTADLDGAFDLRARIPDTGKVSSGLHSSYFRLTGGSSDPRGLHINIFGLDQYGAYRWQQATVEKEFGGQGNRLPDCIQVGQIRLPFGIYDFQETYSSGLMDYPIPRGDYGFDSVNWGVPGIAWSGGTSAIQGDLAAFSGTGNGVWGNTQHVHGVAGRAQVFLPPNAILGFSGWNGGQASFPHSPSRPVHLGGVDLRYTLSHLLLRGEALGGALANARRMRGGYLDAYYRLPGIETVTLVGRVEALKPDDNVPQSHQLTLGVRWTASRDWTLAANWRRNNLKHAYPFNWTPSAEGRGDLYLQILRTFRFSTPDR